MRNPSQPQQPLAQQLLQHLIALKCVGSKIAVRIARQCLLTLTKPLLAQQADHGDSTSSRVKVSNSVLVLCRANRDFAAEAEDSIVHSHSKRNGGVSTYDKKR